MKVLALLSAAALAVAMAGCQKSTTTAPVTPDTTRTDDTTIAPSTTPATSEVKKLTVMTATDQTVERGESDEMLVTINRDNFNDAVKISLNALPAGIIAEQSPVTIAAGDNSATLKLTASADAAVGEHKIELVAEAPGMEKNVQLVTLKVKAKD